MIKVLGHDTDYINALGNYMVNAAREAILDHDYFAVAFSGGSAATKVSTCLKNKEFSNKIDFTKWKIFLSDERYVGLEDPDSNFKAIHDGFLHSHPEISKENIFTLSLCNSVEEAAEDYQKKLQKVFVKDSFPSFDLIILGMGPDGHICSLFPNHPLLEETGKWIASISNSPKPPPCRITFTLNLVNSAKRAIFIAVGEGKAAMVKAAIEDGASKTIPASLVKLHNGELTWFLDNGAASLLKK